MSNAQHPIEWYEMRCKWYASEIARLEQDAARLDWWIFHKSTYGLKIAHNPSLDNVKEGRMAGGSWFVIKQGWSQRDMEPTETKIGRGYTAREAIDSAMQAQKEKP